MTDTMLAANAKLYAKMEESFQDFSNWLLKQQPEEILNHAYEYATKADILAIIETTDLDDAQANALLALDDPLDAVFKEFGDSSSNSMDVLVSFIEDKADELVSLNQSQADVQVYPYSAEVAEREDDLEWYRQSTKLNIACKEAIETAISRHYRNNTLDPIAVKNVVAQFGWPRTAFVLANTVRNKDWDARISHDNKDWAKRIPIYPDVNTFGEDKRLRYVVDSHAGLTDLFINALRREYRHEKDQPEKPSVREKLQATVKTTSPKISAQKKTLER